MLTLMATTLRRLERGGLLPVLVLIVCIQGTVIVGQFLAALLLTPSELGVIRSLESALSVMVLVGSVGAQALSVRDIAGESDPQRRMLVLRNLIVQIALGTSVVAAAAFATRMWMPPSVILDGLVLCSGIVLLSNLLRAMAGFAQGSGGVLHYYRPLMLLSGASLVIQMLLAAQWRIDGWIAARYLGEGLTVIGLMAVVHRLNPPIPWFAPLQFGDLLRSIRHGVAVNVSLVLRLLADTLPVLALTAYRVPTDQIGVFGLASLVLMSVTLPLAVLAQRAIPEFVVALNDPPAIDRLVARLRRHMLLTGGIGAAVLVVGGLAAYRFIGGEYAQAFAFAALLAVVLPVKAFALNSGTHLMVLRRYAAAVWANLAEAVLVASICVFFVPRFGTYGAAAAVLIGALMSASMLYLMSVRARSEALRGTGVAA